MAKKFYEESNIVNIGRALQMQLNTSSSFSVAEMASAIFAINTQTSFQLLSCSQNGKYVPPSGVDGFNAVIISVPASPSTSLISKSISLNGTYLASSDGADGFCQVVISVPAGASANLSSLSVSINGTYTPSGNIDGFDNVIVDVRPNLTTLFISENGCDEGRPGIDGYYSVEVSVPTSTIGRIENCLSGFSLPTSEIGNVGDLYLNKISNQYRYFRLIITKVRTSGSGCQFSRLCVNDFGDFIVDEATGIIDENIYPIEATIWCNKDSDASNHLVQNLIDNNTNTKFYTAHNPTVNDPIIIEVDMGSFYISDRGTINDWQFFSADDKPECDPVSFIVQVSADGENWITVDQQTDYDLLTTRNAGVYHADFSSISSNTFFEEVYVKKSTGWIKAIGAVI